jgi:circadian clock protein KaiC
VPEHGCGIIGGGPGTGKTSLALQMLFANASPDRPGLYCTGAGERPHKLLEHQQQLGLLPCDRPDIHVLNLGQPFAERDLGSVLDAIEREIQRRQAGFVVVDLVRSLAPADLWADLALLLSTAATSSAIVLDAAAPQMAPEALLSIADCVTWLHADEYGRTIEAIKARGQRVMPGRHTMRLTPSGLRAFPRWATALRRVERRFPTHRLSLGSEDLDCVLGGGIPACDAVLVDGAAGTGKSVLASQFIAEAGHRGEPGLVILFEERPDRFVARAEALDLELARLVQGGLIEVVSFRGRDLDPDELIHEVQQAVRYVGAECLVIDSTAGLQLALHDDERLLRDCMWRMLDVVTSAGVTAWINSAPELAHLLTPLVDDVLELRRLERHGRVEHRLAVVKMSGGNHSTDPCAYTIIERGLQLLLHESANLGGSNGHLPEYDEKAFALTLAAAR